MEEHNLYDDTKKLMELNISFLTSIIPFYEKQLMFFDKILQELNKEGDVKEDVNG